MSTDPNALTIVARMHSNFPAKFGIPRQSGIIETLTSTVVFEPEFRSHEALRGLSLFSHIWLIWGFSEALRDEWSPTVRPPRMGGNRRMGVFATRSPFRPNALGLSSVKLLGIEHHPQWGDVLHVAGADLMDGTPIYDIKPYLAYTDSHPGATGTLVDEAATMPLTVHIPEDLCALIGQAILPSLRDILAHDPRPSYHADPARIYGMAYAGLDVKFVVVDGQLTVTRVDQGELR